uniref:Uncharacterized protein n=1 Tax=Bionectria ochroleuca TaxID=29856 RepID=A0A8H7NAH8_BIOOC
MFSSKDMSKPASPAPNGSDSANRPRGSSFNNNSSVTSGTATPMSRKESVSDQGSTKVTKPKELTQRFMLNPAAPGGHEHHLKSSRRQEKLSDMWRTIIGKKQDAPDPTFPWSLTGLILCARKRKRPMTGKVAPLPLPP